MITSAGVVLAGTFTILALLPVVALRQLGFVIAVGVLLDTSLVRSLVLPATVLDLGNRVRWPAGRPRAGAGDGAPAAPPRPTGRISSTG